MIFLMIIITLCNGYGHDYSVQKIPDKYVEIGIARNEIIKRVKTNELVLVDSIIRDMDEKYLGFRWISFRERAFIELIKGNDEGFINNDELLLGLWENSESGGFLNSFCRPKTKDAVFGALEFGANLENVLYEKFDRLRNENLIPPEISWIEKNSNCSDRYNESRFERRKRIQVFVEKYVSIFKKNDYLPKKYRRYYNTPLMLNGNHFGITTGLNFFKSVDDNGVKHNGFGPRFGLSSSLEDFLFKIDFSGHGGVLKSEKNIDINKYGENTSVYYNTWDYLFGKSFRVYKNVRIDVMSGFSRITFEIDPDGDDVEGYKGIGWAWPVTVETKFPLLISEKYGVIHLKWNVGYKKMYWNSNELAFYSDNFLSGVSLEFGGYGYEY